MRSILLEDFITIFENNKKKYHVKCKKAGLVFESKICFKIVRNYRPFTRQLRLNLHSCGRVDVLFFAGRVLYGPILQSVCRVRSS